MAGEIRGAQYPIEKVFSDDFTFSIPEYQRPFSWGKTQASELYEDLKLALGDGTLTFGEVKPYFLGTIVLVKGDSPDSDVVDGQQRLITLTILFAALRLKHPDQENSRLTRYIYQEPVPAVNRHGRYRLQLRPPDAHYFATNIQEPGKIARLNAANAADLPDSQKQIFDVAIYFMNRLSTEPAEFVRRLTEFILTKCMLVVVSTSDFDSAFNIFTVLNNRGIDLSIVDILKSDILGRALKSGQLTAANVDMYVDQWEDLEQNLGRRGMEELVSHTRTIFQRTERPQGTILQGFNEDIVKPNLNHLPGIIDNILSPLGKALYTINTTSYRNNSYKEQVRQINHLLGWLNRLSHSEWVPSAMLYLSEHTNEPDNVLNFLQKLERLGAMFLVNGMEPTGRAKRYVAITRAVREKRSPDVLDLTDDERKSMLGRLGRDIYSRRNPVTRMYILLRLDDALTDPEFRRGGAGYPSGITIEHVLPQSITPGSPWLTAWGGCWKDSNTRKQWVNKLGNLILLAGPKNTKAGNKDFKTKIDTYFGGQQGAPFQLTVSAAREKEWTVDVVRKRQQLFLQKLAEVWQL